MMCKNINKNKRGFSLVELMVVVAIMGTLAAIAIPAYNEYRKSAKKAAYKSDLNSLHKGWLAFGVELDSFCERETSPNNASVANVGMESLLSSKLYGNTPGSSPGKANFIGFSATAPAAPQNCPTVGTPAINLYSTTVNDEKIRENNVVTGMGCTLGITTYKAGVFGHFGGRDYIPIEISNTGVVEEHNVVTEVSGMTPIAATTVVCT